MVKRHLRERNARSVFETRSFLLVDLVDAVFMGTSDISQVEREKHGYRCSFGKILCPRYKKWWEMRKFFARSSIHERRLDRGLS